jgi:hypothetical protein
VGAGFRIELRGDKSAASDPKERACGPHDYFLLALLAKVCPRWQAGASG